jgi:superfamily II DNA/RNA helicase
LVACGREPPEKRERLREVIRESPDFNNAIIFCNRKRDVAIVHRSLLRHGFNAAALHGDLDQRARMAALDSFRTGEVKLLVASDVAARGLDIPAVSHILNYDVPHHPEDYVHRIGRTGRAGRTGHAITLVAPGDEKSLAAIERLIGQPIPWSGPSVAEMPGERRPPPRERGRKSGDRNARRQGGRPPSPAPERTKAPPAAHNRAPSPTPERSKPPKPAPRPPQDRRGADEGPVVGLGEHVPAFLMRPTFSKGQK